MRDILKEYRIAILKLITILILIVIAVYSCDIRCNVNTTNTDHRISTNSTTDKNMESTVTGLEQVRVVLNDK